MASPPTCRVDTMSGLVKTEAHCAADLMWCGMWVILVISNTCMHILPIPVESLVNSVVGWKEVPTFIRFRHPKKVKFVVNTEACNGIVLFVVFMHRKRVDVCQS